MARVRWLIDRIRGLFDRILAGLVDQSAPLGPPDWAWPVYAWRGCGALSIAEIQAAGPGRVIGEG